MTSLNPIRPLRVDEIDPASMSIEWNDGLLTHHSYRLLRFNCQCALCREEHTGQLLIALEDIPGDIFPRRIVPVGTYALSFEWSDGHLTGIYSFDLLRRLDERDFGAPQTCENHGTGHACGHGHCAEAEGILPTWSNEE